ncbi:MAG: translation initiation factor IF-2 [Chlamydiae bacterium]|nr:translation initiation factor IF-2 [Chlamydiota bacterium]MBI3277905.1 translation initiation factor IF-2 [Chlamydiota bacterium]
MRVHELAKELAISSKVLIEDLKVLGFEAKNHMSALDPKIVEKIRARKKEIHVDVSSKEKTSSDVKKNGVFKSEESIQPSETLKNAEKKATDSEKPILESPLSEPSSDKKNLEIALPMTVRDFAGKVGVSPNVVISKLIELGEMLGLNQFLTDQDMVSLLAGEYGFKIQFVSGGERASSQGSKDEEVEKPVHLTPRPPVVTFMGHVDHGKTSLLDQIRKTKLAERESGGITQHMGAYQVDLKRGGITFLDTPGHEAFTLMRARGAQVTDIVVLVIAADDGMMPQTLEALDHCRAAGVPIIVAINKMDRPGVTSDKVKRQLSEKNLLPEDWGGQTIVCEVSAKTGAGIDHLLEMILLQAEIMELKADSTLKARGIVIESELSKERGATATLLVRQGTFKVGDAVICGAVSGRIKALYDDQGKLIEKAGPSTPVELLGLSEVPEIGIELKVAKNEKIARQLAEKKKEELNAGAFISPKKVTLEDIFQQISEKRLKELRLILKADVQGSLEALHSCLANLKSEQVELKFIHDGVGEITENDVMLASASGAIIIGFHVKISVKTRDLAKKEGVDIRLYSIIYEIADHVKKALEGLLEPIESEVVVGHALVRQVFDLSKYGKIAGCGITDGKVLRSSKVRVIRNNDTVFEGMIQSLKRFKDEVKEVREGSECGIRLNSFEEIQEGDTLEFFDIEKTAQKL